jgi:hypothetical protein
MALLTVSLLMYTQNCPPDGTQYLEVELNIFFSPKADFRKAKEKFSNN